MLLRSSRVDPLGRSSRDFDPYAARTIEKGPRRSTSRPIAILRRLLSLRALTYETLADLQRDQTDPSCFSSLSGEPSLTVTYRNA